MCFNKTRNLQYFIKKTTIPVNLYYGGTGFYIYFYIIYIKVTSLMSLLSFFSVWVQWVISPYITFI